jgi:hypothetical protein
MYVKDNYRVLLTTVVGIIGNTKMNVMGDQAFAILGGSNQ